MVNYSRYINIPLHILRVSCDEVGRVNASQGVCAQDHLADFQMFEKSDEQQSEVLGRSLVATSTLVLSVKAWNGQIHPSATFAHFFLKSRPFNMVSRSSVKGKNGVLQLMLAVRNVAVPPLTKIYSFLAAGLIQSFLLLSEFNTKSIQISVYELLDKEMLLLALLLRPLINDMVVLLLRVTAHLFNIIV